MKEKAFGRKMIKQIFSLLKAEVATYRMKSNAILFLFENAIKCSVEGC